MANNTEVFPQSGNSGLLQRLERMLTRRDLTRLLIKVIGLFILLGAAIDLPTAIFRFGLQMNGWETARVAFTLPTAVMVGASYFGPIAAYVVVGLSFMWWSGGIVDRASQAREDGDLPVVLASTDLKDIEVSLVTVIGLYFLADGFAELCRTIFSQGVNYGLGGLPTSESFWARVMRSGAWLEIPWFVQALVKLTIGALLVLGRGATVATLRQARYWVRKWRTWPYQPE